MYLQPLAFLEPIPAKARPIFAAVGPHIKACCPMVLITSPNLDPPLLCVSLCPLENVVQCLFEYLRQVLLLMLMV